MGTFELIYRSIITLWILSLAFGLCAAYTPWAWSKKESYGNNLRTILRYECGFGVILHSSYSS